jgi:hypothetical protein
MKLFARNKQIKTASGKHIFIACMPKSSSTFLTEVLSDITGYSIVNFRQKPINNFIEQEINISEIEKYRGINTVTQQHTRGSEANFKILEENKCFTLVLVRNIFDIVISSFDHSQMTGLVGSSLAYANNEYFKLSDTEKEDFIIKLALPWYFHFYVSWYDRILNSGSKKIRWVVYEDFINDPTNYLKEILRFCECSINSEQIRKSYEKIKSDERKSRINKGVHGRGSVLTEKQKNIICEYTAFYPWVDFSLIGISNKK